MNCIIRDNPESFNRKARKGGLLSKAQNDSTNAMLEKFLNRHDAKIAKIFTAPNATTRMNATVPGGALGVRP